MYKVYKHTTPSGKIYIGVTLQEIRKRWKNGNGYIDNEYFTRAIQKYGWDNIRHEILFDGLTKEEAEAKEIELIAEYRSDQRKYGYNIEHGGSLCGKHSAYTRRKMSEALKGERNPRYGKKFPDQMRNYRKGKQSEATRIRKSEAHKGQEPVNRIAVIQYEKDGRIVGRFMSLLDASKATGITLSNICRACNKQRKSAGGYMWEQV